MQHHQELLNGSITNTLVKMTNSIALGFISIFSFNLLDTFFIAKLGSDQLAAISFIFPVIFFYMSIYFGLNTGITAQVGKHIGKKNYIQAKNITINSLIFITITSLLISIIGYYNIDFLFKLLGAEQKLLLYIKQYLSLWFTGSVLLMLTMALGAAIRGQGNAKIPSRIMFLSGIINGILDPILIFGLGPLPKLEVTGAVLATVISWFFAFIISLYYLVNHTIIFKPYIKINKILNNFTTNIKQILNISIPAILANILQPLSSMIIIKIVALDSLAAVAAFGVGLRLEAIAIIFVISLSVAMVPFVSLNHGAKNYTRINIGFRYAVKYILRVQIIIYFLLFILSDYIALIFSNDLNIINIISLYLKIIPGVYCFIGFIMIILSSLNALEQSKYSSLINIIRFFILTIPLAYIGQYYYGITGILLGIAMAKILSFIVAFIIYKKVRLKISLISDQSS